MSQLSARFQRNDVAGSLAAPPPGQALDVLLGIVPLNDFHRPALHFVRPDERLDRDHDGVENADLAGVCHSVQRGDYPVLLRVEPLFGTGNKFGALSHAAPQPTPASMCGAAQSVEPITGSTPKDQISWDVFARPASNSHAPTRANSDAGALAPRHPTPASLTLFRDP